MVDCRHSVIDSHFCILLRGPDEKDRDSTKDATQSSAKASETAAKALEANVKTTKAQIAVSLIDQLYSDQSIQNTLDLIYDHYDLQFSKDQHGDPVITSQRHPKKGNLEPKLVIMLNRFQILGQLYDMGILEQQDLRGLRYEVIEIRRNKAVRDYFDFLNHDYQQSSRVVHDHFRNFKDVYMAFEYDAVQKQQFSKYLFEYPPGTF